MKKNEYGLHRYKRTEDLSKNAESRDSDHGLEPQTERVEISSRALRPGKGKKSGTSARAEITPEKTTQEKNLQTKITQTKMRGNSQTASRTQTGAGTRDAGEKGRREGSETAPESSRSSSKSPAGFVPPLRRPGADQSYFLKKPLDASPLFSSSSGDSSRREKSEPKPKSKENKKISEKIKTAILPKGGRYETRQESKQRGSQEAKPESNRNLGPRKKEFSLRLPDKDRLPELIGSLSRREQEEILAHLEPGQRKLFREKMERAGSPVAEPPRSRPFAGASLSSSPEDKRRFLKEALSPLGEEKADRILRKGESPFEFMKNFDALQLAGLLKGESAAVLSVIIGYLPPKLGGKFLCTLPPEQRTDILRRLSAGKKIDKAVLRSMEKALQRKIHRDRDRAQKSAESPALNGSETLLKILRHMDYKQEAGLLRDITDRDAFLGRELKKKAFSPDLILRFQDRDLQEMLLGFDEREIALFLQGQSGSLREKVEGNLSARKKALLHQEEVFLSGRKTGESQKALHHLLQTMEKKLTGGEIILSPRSSGDPE